MVHSGNGDGDVADAGDHTRVYWLLPDIDQRVGFVDIDGEDKTFYYYLTDAQGSVLSVVRDDGEVVCRYDYDSFGNIRPV